MSAQTNCVQFPAMGTTVTVRTRHGIGRAVAAEIRDLFRSWERTLSRFQPDSDVTRINAAPGQAVRVDAVCLDVVEHALRAARATGGLFDPTLGNRMAAIGSPSCAGHTELLFEPPHHTRHRWRAVVVDWPRQTVSVPIGASLDLNGIAKGMAVDAAIAVLLDRGVEGAVVNAGGDLATTPSGDATWDVGLTDAPTHAISLRHGALATSSVLARRWRYRGATHHHLIDSRTALPARSDVVSATVAAATCAQAEVAAKTALILGTRAGSRMLNRLQLPGLLTTPDGASVPSLRWPSPTCTP